jgi:hypothetical protein
MLSYIYYFRYIGLRWFIEEKVSHDIEEFKKAGLKMKELNLLYEKYPREKAFYRNQRKQLPLEIEGWPIEGEQRLRDAILVSDLFQLQKSGENPIFYHAR